MNIEFSINVIYATRSYDCGIDGILNYTRHRYQAPRNIVLIKCDETTWNFAEHDLFHGNENILIVHGISASLLFEGTIVVRVDQSNVCIQRDTTQAWINECPKSKRCFEPNVHDRETVRRSYLVTSRRDSSCLNTVSFRTDGCRRHTYICQR